MTPTKSTLSQRVLGGLLVLAGIGAVLLDTVLIVVRDYAGCQPRQIAWIALWLVAVAAALTGGQIALAGGVVPGRVRVRATVLVAAWVVATALLLADVGTGLGLSEAACTATP